MLEKNTKKFSQILFGEWAKVNVNGSGRQERRFITLQNNLKLLVWTEDPLQSHYDEYSADVERFQQRMRHMVYKTFEKPIYLANLF